MTEIKREKSPKWKEQKQSRQEFLPLILKEQQLANPAGPKPPSSTPAISLRSHKPEIPSRGCHGSFENRSKTRRQLRHSGGSSSSPGRQKVKSTHREPSQPSPANIWLRFVFSGDAVHEDPEHLHLPRQLSPLRIPTAAPRSFSSRVLFGLR